MKKEAIISLFMFVFCSWPLCWMAKPGAEPLPRQTQPVKSQRDIRFHFVPQSQSQSECESAANKRNGGDSKLQKYPEMYLDTLKL